MDITPSSSRALRQRLWGLFASHSTPAPSHSSSDNAPRALTRSGFQSALDALARRSTFLGIFIGSEEDAAICEAAAQLRTPMTRQLLWQAALLHCHHSRRVPPSPATAAVSDSLASNDCFAEDDFFGRQCYRSDAGPSSEVNDSAATSAQAGASVSWEAFHAAVVLHLYDHHNFVHSFLPSEVAALRRCAAKAPAEDLQESGTPLRAHHHEPLSAVTAAAPDLRLRSRPGRRVPTQLNTVERNDGEAVGTLQLPLTPPRRSVADPPSPRPPVLTEWRVRSPRLRTPALPLSSNTPADSPGSSRGASRAAEDFGKPALPLPRPEHTWQETALPSCHAAMPTALATAAPAVSCPSASVSISSSSSCGPVRNLAAVAAAPAAARVPRCTLSPSPAPRRPADAVTSTGKNNVALEGTTAMESVSSPPLEAAAAAAAPPCARGLRLRSASEANVAQMHGTTKSASRRGLSKELQRPHASSPEGAEVGSGIPAGVTAKKPKLACAAGKARGPQRLYTTRRPHGGVGVSSGTPFGAQERICGEAAPSGSRLLQGHVQRPAVAEAWPGRLREASIELVAPPTTRHEDFPSPSQRTPSPSPCVPLHSVEEEGEGGVVSDDRCGTVEHAVEGRRTTALLVQVVDRALADAGRGGTNANSLLPDSVRHASPEKPCAAPSSTPTDEATVMADEVAIGSPSDHYVVPEQPPTQTSRRRVPHQHGEPQHLFPHPSPFSTTREPYARASPTPEATGQRGPTRRLYAAPVLRVTAPSPTPTPREISLEEAEQQQQQAPPPPPPSPPRPRRHVPAACTSTAAAAVASERVPDQRSASAVKQCTRSPHVAPVPVPAASPSQLIGVPRILSSTFTSPRASARGSLGSASARQHSVDVAAQPPERQQKQQREASDEGYRTPPRHWSPEAAMLLTNAPASPLSSVRRRGPLSPCTPSQRPTLQRQTEATTPPPRLSHRARVRSSSRGSRAAPTPPRVPLTRMLMSPSGSLQVTPRRRAPSTSSLV